MLDFWGYVVEREVAREAKERSWPKPWSDDPVIQSTFLTNVFREDDPGTQVAEDIMNTTGSDRKWLEPQTRLWNLLVYRRFNRQETWEESIGILRSLGDQIHAEEQLRERWLRREPVFTSAHQVNALSHLGDRVQVYEGQSPLLERTIWAIRDDLGKVTDLAEQLWESHTLKEAHREIMKAGLHGIGEFLAWQVVLDCELGGDPIVEVHEQDARRWAPSHGGAKLGAAIMWNWPDVGLIEGAGAKNRRKRAGSGDWPVLKKPSNEGVLKHMRTMEDAQWACFDQRGLRETWEHVSGGRDLQVPDIEHALCEASRYWLASAGITEPLRKYPLSGA